MKRIFPLILILSAAIACGPALDGPGGADGPDTENPDKPTPPEEETFVYKVVDVEPTDWTGDYLLMFKNGNEFIVFNSYDGKSAGKSTSTLTSADFTKEGVPAEVGDPMKSIISKVGEYYSINISNVGYIGLNADEKEIKVIAETPTSSDKGYLWTIDLSDAQNSICQIGNAAFPSKKLKWNNSAKMFRCYDSGQEDLTLYRRNVSNGDITDPDNPGGGDIEEPDKPVDPDPIVPSAGMKGWFELPVIVDEDNDGRHDTKTYLYYASHMCAGKEKGPDGKIARNFTTCYSAEDHCPVWVAAPRHAMYLGSTTRTDAYRNDPDIPSDIQRGKWSGYTRGHMLGSSDRTCSDATNRQVFYHSNIAPQVGGTFNTGGGAWNNLEGYIDGLVCADTLYTVVGCYFNQFTDKYNKTVYPKKIEGDSSYPTMYYYAVLRTKKGSTGKAVTECSADELKCAAFVLRHTMEKGHKPQEKDMISIAELERLTGFTYFANVPNAPKNTCNPKDWGL